MRCNLPARLVAVEEQEKLEALGPSDHREPWRGHCGRLGLRCVAAIPAGNKKCSHRSATREEAFTNWPTMSAIS